MRPFTIHPSSILAGVLLTGLALLSMSQTPVLNARTINVQYLPNPRDYVQVREGTPFIVPGGQLFVLTGLGEIGTCCCAQLSVDGQIEVTGGVMSFGVNGAAVAQVSSVSPVPPGLTVPAGATITVLGNGPACLGRAWGYLAPQ